MIFVIFVIILLPCCILEVYCWKLMKFVGSLIDDQACFCSDSLQAFPLNLFAGHSLGGFRHLVCWMLKPWWVLTTDGRDSHSRTKPHGNCRASAYCMWEVEVWESMEIYAWNARLGRPSLKCWRHVLGVQLSLRELIAFYCFLSLWVGEAVAALKSSSGYILFSQRCRAWLKRRQGNFGNGMKWTLDIDDDSCIQLPCLDKCL